MPATMWALLAERASPETVSEVEVIPIGVAEEPATALIKAESPKEIFTGAPRGAEPVL
jgi:hypothetical protein